MSETEGDISSVTGKRAEDEEDIWRAWSPCSIGPGDLWRCWRVISWFFTCHWRNAVAEKWTQLQRLPIRIHSDSAHPIIPNISAHRTLEIEADSIVLINSSSTNSFNFN